MDAHHLYFSLCQNYLFKVNYEIFLLRFMDFRQTPKKKIQTFSKRIFNCNQLNFVPIKKKT